MNEIRKIVVYGAYGHTGKFVVGELVKNGFSPILAGRDLFKLEQFAPKFPNLEIRSAKIDEPDALDEMLSDASAVINCAGPFLDTGNDLIESAIRNRVNYFDVAAEQIPVLKAFEKYADLARQAEIVVMPAVAFYGGLADLLATSAAADWTEIDSVEIFTALDSWHPTQGTRLTGERNTFRRYIFKNGNLEFIGDPLKQNRNFAEPFGQQEMIEIPLTETVTISRHLPAKEIRHYLNQKSLNDLRNPDTPPPQLDESGRSPQLFLMEAIVRQGAHERKATASGRDIYHITAPLLAEAIKQVFSNNKLKGVMTIGQIPDSTDFLQSLSPEYLSISFSK